MTRTTYDRIGTTYGRFRRPDPRIAAQIQRALGGARTIVDVGAGTGSYEPRRGGVVALEPSVTMIAQRPPGAAPVVRGVAEALPFPDRSFDAALAVLTIHHWADPEAGLAELARVSRRQVVLTWDKAAFARYWLIDDYFPEVADLEAGMAARETVARILAVEREESVLVPADCTDGFCGAYWRRPEAYLDPATRRAISAFSLCPDDAVRRVLHDLRRDIDDGTWRRRYAQLADMDAIDLGYRLITAGGLAP